MNVKNAARSVGRFFNQPVTPDMLAKTCLLSAAGNGLLAAVLTVASPSLEAHCEANQFESTAPGSQMSLVAPSCEDIADSLGRFGESAALNAFVSAIGTMGTGIYLAGFRAGRNSEQKSEDNKS